jgi:hypothetical protein
MLSRTNLPVSICSRTVVEPSRPDGLFVPPDRRGSTHLGHFFDRQPLGVDVRVGEIEAGGQIGDRLRGLLGG